MALSRFPFGFAGGIALQGLPIVTAASNQVIWVDSATGNDGNVGSISAPVATIAGAISQIKNNVGGNRIGNTTNGSVILLKPGHTETLAVATTYSLANVSIIGVSSGNSDVPKLILSAVGSSVILGAASMMLQNIRISANAAATTCVKLAAQGCILNGVQILDGTANFVTGVSILGGGSNFADGCKIVNCLIDGGAATQGIFLNEVDDLIVIDNNVIYGTYSLSPIANPTGKILTSLTITNNKCGSVGNGVKAISIVSACTGICMGNYFQNSNATTITTITGLLSAGNSIA